MNSHRSATLLAALAAAAMDGAPPRRPGVLRCEPAVDAQTLVDLTAVCARCKRRLTMDDIGGGPPGGPAKPLPVCQGEAKP